MPSNESVPLTLLPLLPSDSACGDKLPFCERSTKLDESTGVAAAVVAAACDACRLLNTPSAPSPVADWPVPALEC